MRTWQAALVVLALGACSSAVQGHPSQVSTSASSHRPAPVQVRHPERFTSVAAAKGLSAATTVTAAQTLLQSFVSQYRLTMEITKVPPSEYADEYDSFRLATGHLDELKVYGAIFIDEWAKYPTDWVAASGLRSIALVTHLGVAIDTGDPHKTLVAATPDPSAHRMIYDIGFGGDYARQVIHHEFDHLIEYHRSGEFSRPDPTWQSYNPRGFTYGHGGASCYQPGSTCLTGDHPIPGFVSGYAASAIAEDKAETYAYLMVGREYHHLLGWIKHDSALAHKVAAYEATIARQSPEMAGSYFSAIDP